ncbi:MAG: SH3 domain-containing protein [Nitrospirae bacterium]|nr:SH3 domain-containing protein [Nitrospirota bacterium]
MALTEEEKKRIKEEELFRAKISGEISGQKKVNWKTYFISSLIIWAIAILLVVWYYLLPMATQQQQAAGVYQIDSKGYISGRDKNGNLVKEMIELLDRPSNVSGEPITIGMVKNGTKVKITDRQIWYYVTIVDEKGEGKSGWVSEAFVRPHDI